MKKLLKVVAFITVMVAIVISSKRIADYLVSSYEEGIAYLAQASMETKNFVIYR